MAWANQFFGLGEESTWGTGVSRTEWIGLTGNSYQRKEFERIQSALITDIDVSSRQTVRSAGSGLIETRLAYKGMRNAIAFLFNIGDASITDAGAGPDYTHEYKLGGIGPGWTTEMHYGFPDASLESMLSQGAKCQTAQWNFVDGQEVLISGNFNAKDCIQSVKSTQTLPDYDTHGVTICQILCEVDDATAPVLGCQINVDHTITSRSRLSGSCDLTEQEKDTGQRAITGTLTAEWDDKTLFDLFSGETNFKLEIIGTGPVIGGGPETFAFTMLLNNCQFDTDPIGIGDGGIVTRGMTFTSFADATHSPLKLTMTNDAAAG